MDVKMDMGKIRRDYLDLSQGPEIRALITHCNFDGDSNGFIGLCVMADLLPNLTSVSAPDCWVLSDFLQMLVNKAPKLEQLRLTYMDDACMDVINKCKCPLKLLDIEPSKKLQDASVTTFVTNFPSTVFLVRIAEDDGADERINQLQAAAYKGNPEIGVEMYSII